MLGDKSGSSAITVLSHDSSMYIFYSHSRDGSGMPSANGTAVLMQFDDIQSTVPFICELADCLAARLFHWTFWHSVSSTDCDCNTSFGQNVAPIGMLSEEEIMNLYFELQPTVSQRSDRKNYYQSHKQKAQQSETAEQTSQRRHSDKLHKKASRADETPQHTKHRQQMNKTNMSQTRLAKKLKVETVDDAMKIFKAECKNQPVYICTSCHRLLWRKGVQKFSIHKYNKIKPEITQLVLDEKYRISSIDGSMYICHTCHGALKLGRIPSQSKANRMTLDEIPDELKDLNTLELHIICKRILFMKLVKLPRGKQKGIRGAAVNVPADLGPACNLLPRLPADAQIVSLKLKRNLSTNKLICMIQFAQRR